MNTYAPAIGMEISDSIFSGNIARAAGGATGSAIRHTHGDFSLIRTTVTQNLCEGSLCAGGAVFITSDVDSSSLRADFLGNVIASNVGGGTPDLRVIESRGPIDFSASSSVHGSIEVPSGSVSNSVEVADPFLSALGDHGGPFQTHVPLPGSPALRLLPMTGEVILDARGELRRAHNSDSGAVERRQDD